MCFSPLHKRNNTYTYNAHFCFVFTHSNGSLEELGSFFGLLFRAGARCKPPRHAHKYSHIRSFVSTKRCYGLKDTLVMVKKEANPKKIFVWPRMNISSKHGENLHNNHVICTGWARKVNFSRDDSVINVGEKGRGGWGLSILKTQ